MKPPPSHRPSCAHGLGGLVSRSLLTKKGGQVWNPPHKPLLPRIGPPFPNRPNTIALPEESPPPAVLPPPCKGDRAAARDPFPWDHSGGAGGGGAGPREEFEVKFLDFKLVVDQEEDRITEVPAPPPPLRDPNGLHHRSFSQRRGRG